MSASLVCSPVLVWRPLVICPHGELARRIGATLSELGVEAAVVRHEYPRPGELAALAAEQVCNICFIDVVSNPEQAQALIADAAPAVPVVALHQRNDADLILRCLRRGACEYLADPTPELVGGVFERLGHTRPAANRPSGAIYCVIPGKPGCGASSLGTQLAVEMHTGDSRVLLVDTDPMSGSVSFLLKLKSEFHLGDALRDWQRMDDDLWARLTVNAAGIDVLAAPESAATRIEIGPSLAGELCAFWRERYAVTVLDLPDARTAVDYGFAALADAVLLVTTNELAALQATRRALASLDYAAINRARLRLILNRYTPATGLKRDDVKTALGLEPFAMLSNDYETMQASMLDGKPAPAGSRFAASVHALCGQLAPKSAAPKPNGSWLSSLLRR